MLNKQWDNLDNKSVFCCKYLKKKIPFIFQVKGHSYVVQFQNESSIKSFPVPYPLTHPLQQQKLSLISYFDLYFCLMYYNLELCSTISVEKKGFILFVT